jgi:hypothetical protein
MSNTDNDRVGTHQQYENKYCEIGVKHRYYGSDKADDTEQQNEPTAFVGVAMAHLGTRC